MLHVLGNKITIQQGDYALMKISLIDSKGLDVPLSLMDSFTLVARYVMESDDYLVKKSLPITKEENSHVYHMIQFNSEDTIDLRAGDYYYDLILESNNRKFTIIDKAILSVKESLITNNEEQEVIILDSGTEIDTMICTPLVGVFTGIRSEENILDMSDDLILF